MACLNKTYVAKILIAQRAHAMTTLQNCVPSVKSFDNLGKVHKIMSQYLVALDVTDILT